MSVNVNLYISDGISFQTGKGIIKTYTCKLIEAAKAPVDCRSCAHACRISILEVNSLFD